MSDATEAPQVWACTRCSAAFTDEDWSLLHAGRRHAGSLGPAERERFDAAVQREEEELIIARRHIRAGFTVLPLAGFYVFTLALFQQYAGNPAWILAITPGFAAFGALLYGMSLSRQQAKAEGRMGGPGS